MRTMRARCADLGRQTGHEIGARFGRELRSARMMAGMTQRSLGKRAGVSQPLVSRIERGVVVPNLDLMSRVCVAVGSRLSVKIYPGDSLSLRDSGQLTFADAIRAQLHSSWRVALEIPIGTGDDRRAGDVFVENTEEAVLIEVETRLHDWQGQTRPAQLKRAALSERLGRAVRLVLAIADSESNRRAAAGHADLIQANFPVQGRAAWAALRSGRAVDGDALVWVRRPASAAHR